MAENGELGERYVINHGHSESICTGKNWTEDWNEVKKKNPGGKEVEGLRKGISGKGKKKSREKSLAHLSKNSEI